MNIQSPDGPMTRVVGQYLSIRSGPKIKSKGNGFENPMQEGKKAKDQGLSIGETLGVILPARGLVLFWAEL